MFASDPLPTIKTENMMKLVKHIETRLRRGLFLLLAAGSGVTAGCSDFLVRDVPNQTTDEEWWQNKSQLNNALKKLYQPMPSGCMTYVNRDNKATQRTAYCNQRVEMEALTDNGVASANYVSYDNFTAGITPTNEEVCVNIWEMKWTIIRRCCRFLEHYRQATIAPDPVPHEGIQTVDRMAAEATALRAFYHMELFFFYGRIPIVDHSVTPEEQFLVRQPEERIVEWIAGEFERASLDLPTVPQTKSERWRWTKGACYAWMSYLYLYASDWAHAKKWAQEVVDLHLYELYRSQSDPADSYRLQFIHEAYNNDTKESILTTELGFRQVQRRLAQPGGGNGQTGLSPTASLVDAYELLDGRTLDELPAAEKRAYELDPQPEKRDPRLGMSVIFPTETFLGYQAHPWEASHKDAIGKEGSTQTGYWVKKWQNETDRQNYTSTDGGKLDFQIMRYAVVLLNYVEAAVEMNELSDPNIYDFLDDIRDRAGMPPVDRAKYASQSKLRELVRRERRVELAFEGHRFFDLRRWRIAEQVMQGTVYGAKPPQSDDRYVAQTRVFNPARDYLWPVPAAEMSTNTGMEQNPGY